MPRPASDSSIGDPDAGDPPARERRLMSQQVVRSLLRRWDRGEVTNDDETIADHGDLLPEIAEELRSARLVRGAFSTARRSAPPLLTVPTRIDLPTDDDLYAPIDTDAGNGGDEGWDLPNTQPVPRVSGLVGIEPMTTGGQATVYRAVQESTGRTVALKVIAEDAAGDSRHRARFVREAEALAALRHPHIVDILDRGRTTGGACYILMEYVEGADFDDWCAALGGTPSDTHRLLELFAKICRAVEEAHARGIVHRDLKPSNVRVDLRGDPRVLDFGLARSDTTTAATRHKTITETGQLVGSIPWASPEQAAGESDRVDARTDVYSLGAMLYGAVAGEPPYPTSGPLYELLHNIAKVEPPRPTSRPKCRRLPVRTDWFDAVVLKAIAKPPDDRYATAGALADDLDRLLAGRRVLACPPPRTPRSIARRAMTWAAVVIAAAVSAWWILRPPEPPTVFALPVITNSADMRLVKLPPGKCFIGSPLDEPGRQRIESYYHTDVNGFFIATTEVTQAQYRDVTGKLPPNQIRVDPKLPVHGVSWDEAFEFCRVLSEREGRQYRLPTEEEWEYACRAGSNAAFFVKDGMARVGWSAENSGGQIKAVAEKWPNCWGLYDMHGNVYEWCEHTPPAPDGPPLPAIDHNRRPVRGGASAEPPENCRAASRAHRVRTSHRPDVGFRVVLEIKD